MPAKLLAAIVCVLAVTPAHAQDECITAAPLTSGVAVPFDTSTATVSIDPWSCPGAGGPDLWYSYVASINGGELVASVCASPGYIAALGLLTGNCTSLTYRGCNAGSLTCGPQNNVYLGGLVAGQTYYFRVGGQNGASGQGTLLVEETPAPVWGCILNPGFETSNLSGWWYFTDATAPSLPGSVRPAGTSPGFGLFVSAPTQGAFSFTHGFDAASPGVIKLTTALTVRSGTTPLTFDYRAGWDMASAGGSTMDREFDLVVQHGITGPVLQRTNILTAAAGTMNLDTGPLSASVDLSGFLGQTILVSFEWTIPEASTGPGHFELDNISCPVGLSIGYGYCGAELNSTGSAAYMTATGTTSIAANSFTIVANQLPPGSFGMFITSLTQGFVANPAGSDGNLCLAGAIGRFTGPGQVQSAGMNGQVSLLTDLTGLPTPSGSSAPVSVGMNWNFQMWYRDAIGGVATSSFTDALRVIF